jgi:hypothetical protein
MLVLGLLVLLCVAGVAVFVIVTRDRARSAARLGPLGYHLPGQGSLLFFFGLVLAAAAVSGLASMVGGAGVRASRSRAGRGNANAVTNEESR